MISRLLMSVSQNEKEKTCTAKAVQGKAVLLIKVHSESKDSRLGDAPRFIGIRSADGHPVGIFTNHFAVQACAIGKHEFNQLMKFNFVVCSLSHYRFPPLVKVCLLPMKGNF